jgi:Zn-dependent peptidase ImmA (M78 family)
MTVIGARRKAEALVQRLNVGGPPVDVIHIAEGLGIRVVKTQLGNSVSGALLTREGQPTILIERGHSRKRQRFTIAHEIGHYWLGHQFEPGEQVHVDGAVSMRNERSTEGTDQKEIEANQFAASLLMPRAMLDEELRRSGGVVTEAMVTELANKFDVSEQAMTIRLGALGFR